MSVTTLAKGRRTVRNTVVAAFSALTVAFLAIFAVAPASMALTATSQTSKIASKNVVFYGKVSDVKGHAIKKARVVVYHYANHRQYIDKVVYTGTNGTWKVVKPGAKGRYYLQTTAMVGKKYLKVNTHFDVAPGHAYKLSVQVVKKGYFAFLPVTHY